MKLSDLKNKLTQFPIQKFMDLEISSLTRSSENFNSQACFVAIKGNTWDGHGYIEEAIAKKAHLVVSQENLDILRNGDTPYIVCDDTRLVWGLLSKLWYEDPSSQLFTVGVTGTNGKTTTSCMIEHILNSAACPCGYIGTIGHRLKNKLFPSSLTSPDVKELNSRLQEFLVGGAKAVVMEVSSHALDQKRSYGVEFDTAIFTNLSQDHLDYHGNIGNYFSAKTKIFTELLELSKKENKLAVFNCQDKFVTRAYRELDLNAEKLSFSKESGFHAKYSVKEIGFEGSKFEFEINDKKYDGFVPVPGEFNVENFLCSVFAVKNMVSIDTALNSLVKFPGVVGRLESVNNSLGIHIFIDFAHTPEALKSVLRFLNEIKIVKKSSANIICVFGAGGDRDKDKRPLMAQAVEKYADTTFVTSDNPRTEDPMAIIENIASGFSSMNGVYLEPDRKVAIGKALAMANKGDVVLVAGKGHESYQEINGNKVFYSDRLCIESFL